MQTEPSAVWDATRRMAPAEQNRTLLRGFGVRVVHQNTPVNAPGKWLAGSGSNRPHSRLTAGRAHPECYLPTNWSGCGESNSELLLGRQRPLPIGHTRNWCRATESNGIPPLFRRLCAAATPARRNFGCGGASRTRPSKGMNLARPRVSPHGEWIGNGRRRRLRSVPLQPVRPLSRAYKAHPLTRADAPRDLADWSGQR